MVVRRFNVGCINVLTDMSRRKYTYSVQHKSMFIVYQSSLRGHECFEEKTDADAMRDG